MSKTVLLTGAFGNIGTHVLRHLLAAGHRVVCLDLASDKNRRTAATFGDRIRVIWGDLQQPELIRTLQQRGLTDTSELSVFTALREWRNHF